MPSSFAFLRRPPFSYVVATVICALILGLKLAFDSWIGHVTPFLLFFGAIILSAWNGGRGPGLWAVALSALAASYYFLAPIRSLDLDAVAGTRAFFFIVEGALVAFLTARLRDYAAQMRGQIRRQMALAQISGVALRSGTDDPTRFDDLLESLKSALDISGAALLHLESEPHPLFTVAAETGWRALRECSSLPGDNNSPISHAARSGLPVALADTRNEARFDIAPNVRAEGGACLIAPVGYGTRKWGVLAVHSTRERSWTTEETDFLSAVANTFAVVLERETARQSILESEARYRDFLAHSTEAIWRFELDEPIPLSLPPEAALPLIWERAYLAECNAVFAKMYGDTPPEAMCGLRLSQIMPSDNPKNIAYLQAAWEAGTRISDVESVEIDEVGNEHIFLNNIVGITHDGVLVRIWGTQRDVTQERQIQTLILESERRFRSLFEASPVPIAITRAGVFLFVNSALVELMGYENPDDLLGKHTIEWISSEYQPMILRGIAANVSGIDEPQSYEVEGLRRDGIRVPLRIEVAPLELPDGPATMAFVFDLTEDKAAHAEIAASLKRERQAALRAIRLQEISVALTQPLPLAQITHDALGHALDALGASGGLIMVPDEQRQNLHILAQQGFPVGLFDPEQGYAISDDTPMAFCFRELQPIWMHDLDLWMERFPTLNDTRAITKSRALAALPLEVEGRVVGGLSFSFPQTRQFDEEQCAFMVTLAGLIAGTVERARLDQNAREAARRQRESLALLNTLLDSAPVGFALLDQQGRYSLVNGALAAINGQPIEAHIGKTPLEVAPTLGADVLEIIETVWKTGLPSGEIDIEFPSGETTAELVLHDQAPRHCLASFFPVRVVGEPLLGVGAVILEITERVRAETERELLFDQLEVERARFEAILQQMPSAVVIAEAPLGRMILGNPQVERVMGREFVAARTVEEYDYYKGLDTSGKPLKPEEWPLARAIRTGTIIEGEEIFLTRADGTTGMIRVNAAPIRDKDGTITAGIAVFDDITARARQNAAQEFLSLAGAALLATLDERGAFETLAQMCVPRTADWCIVATHNEEGTLNRVAVAHSDETQTEAAQTFRAQLALDPRLPWDVEGAIQTKKSMLFTDHSLEVLQTSNASEEYIRIVQTLGVCSAIVAPLMARGRVVGVMIWLTTESGRRYDQSDLSLADELARRAAITADNARLLFEAQTARDEAQQANRTKDEFLAVVSHELRTPLTPILGWLDLLRGDDLDEITRRQAYNVIERNANAQAQLINDILDVSRITSGKLRLELREQPIAQLVKGSVEGLRLAAREKGISLETEIAEIGMAQIDATRFGQVIWNLLSNALKFTPTGGTIQVKLDQTTEGMARLVIQDSGVGIAPEFLPHVFDRFRQADSSSTREAGGLGLGLAIVQHIVGLHNGFITAHSLGLGQGSTFTFTLPLVAKSETEAHRNDMAHRDSMRNDEVHQGISLRGVRILLVDDEHDTRTTLELLLQNAGAQVQSAESGARALQMAAIFQPAMIVSDVAMPEMNGYELRAQLREILPNVPALALSAYTAPSDVQQALSAGFEAHLAKPVGSEELLRAVGELMAARQS